MELMSYFFFRSPCVLYPLLLVPYLPQPLKIPPEHFFAILYESDEAIDAAIAHNFCHCGRSVVKSFALGFLVFSHPENA